jgi:hypothetical protein
MRNGRVTVNDSLEEVWDETAMVWHYFILCLETDEKKINYHSQSGYLTGKCDLEVCHMTL